MRMSSSLRTASFPLVMLCLFGCSSPPPPVALDAEFSTESDKKLEGCVAGFRYPSSWQLQRVDAGISPVYGVRPPDWNEAGIKVEVVFLAMRQAFHDAEPDNWRKSVKHDAEQRRIAGRAGWFLDCTDVSESHGHCVRTHQYDTGDGEWSIQLSLVGFGPIGETSAIERRFNEKLPVFEAMVASLQFARK